MALFRVVVTRSVILCGERLEAGMSVDVACPGVFVSDPLGYQGGKRVIDAFWRIYGIEIKDIYALRNYVQFQKIS